MRKRLRMQRGVTSGRIAGGERSNSVSPSSPNHVNYSAGASAGSNAIMVMGDSVGLRAALLGTVAAGALWLGAPRYARADCIAITELGTRTVDCNGAIAGDDPPFIVNGGIYVPDADYSRLNLSYITDHITPGVNTNGISFERTGAGNTITIDTFMGGFDIITMAGGTGIYATADDTIIIDHEGSGTINAGQNGIYARINDGGTGNIGITTTSSGSITGAFYGIGAVNLGDGSIDITASGDVVGTSNDGIFAGNRGNGVSIKTEGTVTGGEHGIRVYFNNSGAVDIVAEGDVEGTNYTGIYANNAGTSISIRTEATVTGGTYGIRALNEGTGGISIVANGDVGRTGLIPSTGIFAQNSDNSLEGITIETHQAVTGGNDGIRASNFGDGVLRITAEGNITGEGDTNNYAGIFAFQSTYGSSLTIIADPGTIVRGYIGISAEQQSNYGGALTINAGNVVGEIGADGIGIDAQTVSSNLTIIAGDVSGGTGIYARNSGDGLTAITTTGYVRGTVYEGIYARASSDSSGLTIETASVTGNTYGIYAVNDGSGALSIAAQGDVIGGALYYDAGIYAINGAGSAGGLSITAEGDVKGTRGIRASNSGSGHLEIITKGDVEGLTVPDGVGILARDEGAGDLRIEAYNVTGYLSGIDAENSGGGALAIVTDGIVESVSSGSTAIRAINDAGTDLTIETDDVTRGGAIGIQANNLGTGAINVTTNGDVDAGNTGINAFLSDSGTDLRIAVQNVTGGNVGIVANSVGSGVLDIVVNGAVTGNLVHGIDAEHINGPIRITVGADASVTSGGALPTNFAIVTDSGATDLTVAGTLNGGGGGAVRFDQNDALDDRLALVTGAVVNGNAFGGPGTDTLALEGNGDGSFNVGQLVDFEIAEKTGSGDWDLTGSNTQITNFAVDAGLLAVNGALPNTAFAVSGGTLGGNGTVGPTTVADGATIAPGNSIGTLTVNGAFTLQAGAIYEVEANAAGQADRVIVAGAVNLSGAVLRVLAENGDYRLRTEYLIIENDGNDAVQGQFREVSTNLAFLTPTVLYDGGTGNDVVLILERIAADFCAVAQTRNQCAVANALDLFPTDDPLFLAVLNQTAAGARQAFDALSGEIHATLPGLLADDSRYVREAVMGRLTQAAYTNADGRVAALGTGGPQVASFNAGIDAQAMALGYDGKHLAPPPPSRSGAAFWTRAYGAWGDFDGDGNAATADRDLGGFLSGVDADIGNGWRAGLAAGGAWSNVSVDARRSNAEVESFNLAGYVGGMAGPLALRGGGAWTWSDIDTNRAVVFPGFFERQSSGYDADTGQIFGEVAYPVAAGRLALEPFAGLAYVGIDTDSFRERGGNLSALNGSSDDEDVGYFSLGLRAATVLHTSSMIVVPKLSAAWQHAFDDVTPGAALAFASNGIGFVIDGVPLAEDSVLLEAGLDLALSPTALLGVSYTGQFADSVSDNGVKGRFTWLF